MCAVLLRREGAGMGAVAGLASIGGSGLCIVWDVTTEYSLLCWLIIELYSGIERLNKFQ